MKFFSLILATLLLLAAEAVGKPPSVPKPLSCPPVRDDSVAVKPVKPSFPAQYVGVVYKECPCGPGCSCGCNETGICSCGNAKVAPHPAQGRRRTDHPSPPTIGRVVEFAAPPTFAASFPAFGPASGPVCVGAVCRR